MISPVPMTAVADNTADADADGLPRLGIVRAIGQHVALKAKPSRHILDTRIR
jgi:hypothetical protein